MQLIDAPRKTVQRTHKTYSRTKQNCNLYQIIFPSIDKFDNGRKASVRVQGNYINTAVLLTKHADNIFGIFFKTRYRPILLLILVLGYIWRVFYIFFLSSYKAAKSVQQDLLQIGVISRHGLLQIGIISRHGLLQIRVISRHGLLQIGVIPRNIFLEI